MKLIALHGRDGIRGFAAVDDEDFDDLNQFRWYRDANGYVRRSLAGRKCEYMHRRILPEAAQVDHINHDKLDNRRASLRACSLTENIRNRRMSSRNKTGYKGVYFHRASGKWATSICKDRKYTHLGLFDSPEKAYAAYCEASVLFHGEFSRVV